VKKVPVGFAFVGRSPFPFMSARYDFRLCEFFVLRSCRRAGVGRRIAYALFSSMLGSWELVVLPRNTGAATFWRSVLPLVASAPAETRKENELHFAFSTRTA
jgi:predicted acetyltransferase